MSTVTIRQETYNAVKTAVKDVADKAESLIERLLQVNAVDDNDDCDLAEIVACMREIQGALDEFERPSMQPTTSIAYYKK
jgi:hypothetical protein